MFPEQREALDTIITKMRIGRMRRRTFIERALSLGVASSTVVTLLEACGSGKVILYWQSEYDADTIYHDLVDYYNREQGENDRIFVYHINGLLDSSRQHKELQGKFNAKRAEDLLSLDIIWLQEFYEYLKPITDQQWPQSERNKYFSEPLKNCTIEGQLWAVPFRIDVGLLYYRTDIGATPPATWEDLARVAEEFQSRGRTKFGYVWQGAQYEGLVCNFIEVLYGYGGSIFDNPDNPKDVTIASPQAVQALTDMVSWIGKASPRDVLTYKEEETRAVWQQGRAAYARSWPNVYGSSSGQRGLDSSQVKDHFKICALPYGGSNAIGHSCLGGWQLGINRQSAHPNEAWTFIQYMLEQQRSAALKGSFTVTLRSVYDDDKVRNENPFYANPNLKLIIEKALPRPVSPKYPDISNAIQQGVHDALFGKAPSQALSDLKSDLEGILSL